MGDFRRAKMNWTKPSVNKMESAKAATQKYNSGEYRISSPWEQQDADVVDEFERNLATLEVHVEHPWEEGSTEVRIADAQRAKAATYKMKSPFEDDPATLHRLQSEADSARGYKFKSMFEIPELTAKQKKVIDEYKMNPPFRCSYNTEEEDKRTARKMSGQAATRQPWTYGTIPLDPVPIKKFPQAATNLWSTPPTGDEGSAPPAESSGDPVLDSLRTQLKSHGAAGIAGLSRKFRIMDDDESGTLDMPEFVKGMKECKVCDLGDKALKHLFRFFDKDDSGCISYDEFLVGVRGVLSARRLSLVQMAFRVLDRDGSGLVEMGDIKGVYNASSHPDVVMEKRTEEEILQEFMQSFQVGKNKDAVITPDEFEQYYANLSCSIDSDDYFELMMRNAWHISGGEGWCGNSTNRRVLVTHADGRQTVEEIQKDLGLKADDKKGMVQRLKAQGLTMASINTNGLGDMGNQYEDPDWVRNRGQAQATADQSAPPTTTRLSAFAGGGRGQGQGGQGGQGKGVIRKGGAAKPVSLAAFA